MFGKGKKIYEPRVRGEMLNLKLLGPECSAPPGLALLKRRRQLAESELATVSAWTYFILSIAQMVLAVVLFLCVRFDKISVLQGVAIIILVSLMQRYAYCVFIDISTRIPANLFAGGIVPFFLKRNAHIRTQKYHI